MSSYFDLSAEDKNALLNNAEAKLGRPAEVLEKDIWVCWALQVLFDPSNTVSMAF